MTALSVALDLGSTRVKACRLAADGLLGEAESEPAPPLTGDDPVRESDPHAYLHAAERALARARTGLPDDVPLGIASQRSSFLLWERAGGRPVTPLVSWQDRRAADWCRRHGEAAARIAERTGLVLSPHYLGPKLAAMLESDGALRRAAAAGRLRLGTLDAWLAWSWSGGTAHRTDATMAARTLLVDLDTLDWSDGLLAAFGVPRALLPEIVPSTGAPLALPGRGRLTATLADQASGVLGVAGARERTAIVNLGTGTFVLRPTRDRALRPRGYLAGPALVTAGGTLWALEGPVNGGAAAVDRHGPGPTPLPGSDPAPDAFCLPDSAGVGAPHWRSDVPLTLSPDAQALPAAERRRVVLEGLVFRIAGILEDLFPDGPAEEVVLCGGLANDAFLAEGLAACLGRTVTVSEEREATLLGVARIAAGVATASSARGDGDAADAPGARHDVTPGPRGTYLRAKRERWSAWVRGVLGEA